MARWVTYFKSPWTIVLVVSVLIFTFWGGPVFTAQSLSHGGRLLASYIFIPLAVAAVLVWQRQWSWGRFGYLSLGLALVKMLITMAVHLWVIPRGARVDARPLPQQRTAGHGYAVADFAQAGSVRILAADSIGYLVAIMSIDAGRAPVRRTHAVELGPGGISPVTVAASIGDSLSVLNRDAIFHTFELSGNSGQLLQVPLPPGRQAIRRPLLRSGVFVSSCSEHPGLESMRVAVFVHPYWALGSGVTEITDVPAGTYEVGIWQADKMHLDMAQPDSTIKITIEGGVTEQMSLEGLVP